jgi:hypothetical protein
LSRVLEKGRVFFFYRPKVEASGDDRHQVASLDDVAKFYMLLSPTNTTRESIHSLLIMTGKMLPRLSQHDRRGAFVDMTSPEISEIMKALGEKEYKTKVSQQHRYSPPARPCGEGIYEIVLHGSSPKHTGHTHFIYELELPIEPG